MNRISQNKGVALVTALLVVSLASTTAVSLSTRQQLDIRRTANLINGDQAWLYARGAEAWSKAILARDVKDNDTDNLKDIWAQRLPPIELPGGMMVGYIEDMQGRINLNNLIDGDKVDSQSTAQLERLLELLELDNGLVQAIVDWLDKDVEATPPGGAEDNYYLGLERAYMTGNRKMISVSELRLVKGFDQKTYLRIAPFVSTLPIRTPINVNTAPAEVLASLSPDISLDLTKQLVKQRQETPYEKIDDFTGHASLKDSKLNKEGLAISSQYYMLHVEVRIVNARASLDSLIFRGQGGKFQILQRSQRLPGIESDQPSS
jgi:general secretion pathway protein K